MAPLRRNFAHLTPAERLALFDRERHTIDGPRLGGAAEQAVPLAVDLGEVAHPGRNFGARRYGFGRTRWRAAVL